jgi:GNAT superfamily N-acetyltransferase
MSSACPLDGLCALSTLAPHVLDNPMWSALSTAHRPLALGDGLALRYPREIAPFLGAEASALLDEGILAPLVEPGETVFLVGPRPRVPSGWEVKDLGLLVQMVCDAPVAEVPGPEIVSLTELHRPAVLELTALVYPHYFRARTMSLGRYFGIFEGGRLAAMIGERMAMPGHREVSAVCTHPDFNGRGWARRLLVWLSNDILSRGEAPFLHVSPANARARRLYEQNGYRTRAEVAFWSLARQPARAR